MKMMKISGRRRSLPRNLPTNSNLNLLLPPLRVNGKSKRLNERNNQTSARLQFGLIIELEREDDHLQTLSDLFAERKKSVFDIGNNSCRILSRSYGRCSLSSSSSFLFPQV